VLPSVPSVSIPGSTALEKAGVVIGILVIGLGLYSKMTGKSFNLGLTGFTGTGAGVQPPPTVASAPPAPPIQSRVGAANPAKAI